MEKEEEEPRKKLEEYIISNQTCFFRVAYSHTGSREAALDAFQNAVVKALEHYHSLRQTKYMETWFYRILLNECYTYIKKSKREISYEPQLLWQMNEGSTEIGDRLEIYEEVMKLPNKMKTVIILRFYEDFSLEEIAKATGSGLSIVKYRLYTGLKRLEHMCKEMGK